MQNYCTRPKPHILLIKSHEPSKKWNLTSEMVFTKYGMINTQYFVQDQLKATKYYTKVMKYDKQPTDIGQLVSQGWADLADGLQSFSHSPSASDDSFQESLNWIQQQLESTKFDWNTNCEGWIPQQIKFTKFDWNTNYESWSKQQIKSTKFDLTEIQIMNQNSVKIVVWYFCVLNLDSGGSVLHFYFILLIQDQ